MLLETVGSYMITFDIKTSLKLQICLTLNAVKNEKCVNHWLQEMRNVFEVLVEISDGKSGLQELISHT